MPSTDEIREELRAFRKKWEAEHPEEAETARLKQENARLQHELDRAKAMEAEAARRRESNRDGAIAAAVYIGGAFLVWLIFRNACASCAYNGTPNASLWDFLAMVAVAGWGLGGIVVGWSVAKWLRYRHTTKPHRT